MSNYAKSPGNQRPRAGLKPLHAEIRKYSPAGRKRNIWLAKRGSKSHVHTRQPHGDQHPAFWGQDCDGLVAATAIELLKRR